MISGGQTEVLGRLLSSFMGSEYTGPVLAIEKHQKLTSWFCSVHSVLVWTQKQLVALGNFLIGINTIDFGNNSFVHVIKSRSKMK